MQPLGYLVLISDIKAVAIVTIFRSLCLLCMCRAKACPGHDPIGERGARESEGSAQPEIGPAGEEPGGFATGESEVI